MNVSAFTAHVATSCWGLDEEANQSKAGVTASTSSLSTMLLPHWACHCVHAASKIVCRGHDVRIMVFSWLACLFLAAAVLPSIMHSHVTAQAAVQRRICCIDLPTILTRRGCPSDTTKGCTTRQRINCVSRPESQI